MPLEQPQSIRTIFFDAGFTLLHSSPSDLDLCLHICHQLDLHLLREELEQSLVSAEDYFFRHMRLHRHTWSNEAAIAEFWQGYYTTLLRPFVEEHDERRLCQLANTIVQEYRKHTSWELYPDVLPTLETLRSHGYTLGIISDWDIALGPILRKLHLTPYFDCLIISAATRHAKPSPRLYELALERSNSIADYSLHIGDSYINDVLGARAVGITPILLDRAHRLDVQYIDCILVHSLTDILNLLEVAQP